jgi:hypothetical protein
MLHGRTAKEAWRALLLRFPETARGIKAVPTVHPGRPLVGIGEVARVERLTAQREAFRLVRQLIIDPHAHALHCGPG